MPDPIIMVSININMLASLVYITPILFDSILFSTDATKSKNRSIKYANYFMCPLKDYSLKKIEYISQYPINQYWKVYLILIQNIAK